MSATRKGSLMKEVVIEDPLYIFIYGVHFSPIQELQVKSIEPQCINDFLFYISIFQFCCKNYAGLSIQYFKTKTILKLYLPKKSNKYIQQNFISIIELDLEMIWIRCKSKGSCSSTNHICAEKNSKKNYSSKLSIFQLTLMIREQCLRFICE